MSKQAATLDDRIADTFAGDETSQAIAALLQEVQQTSADAKATSEAAEQRALNPRLRPAEVDAARKEMEDANFRSKRMDAAAVQLKDLLSTAKAKEAAAASAAEYEACKAERDELVKDLAEYEKHAAAIATLLDRLLRNNERIIRANAGQSSTTWLFTSEMIARGANEEFGLRPDSNLPDFLNCVKLPVFKRGQNGIQGYLWPKRSY